MRRGNRVRTITVAFVLLSPAVVAAQGNGHGHAYGLNKNQGFGAVSGGRTRRDARRHRCRAPLRIVAG